MTDIQKQEKLQRLEEKFKRIDAWLAKQEMKAQQNISTMNPDYWQARLDTMYEVRTAIKTL